MRIAAFKPTVNALKLSTHHESKHSGSRNQPEVDAVKLGLSWVATSVIRLADFYKFLTTNCLTKVAQIFWWLLAEITSLLCKKVYLLFGQFLGEIRQIFPSFYHLVTLVVTQTFSPIVRSFGAQLIIQVLSDTINEIDVLGIEDAPFPRIQIASKIKIIIRAFQISVTRWLDYLFILSHLQQWKIVHWHKILTKAGSNCCPILPI